MAAFLLNLETEVFALRRELPARTWTPGPYRIFTVSDPKPPVIAASPFRDRVVHNALTSHRRWSASASGARDRPVS